MPTRRLGRLNTSTSNLYLMDLSASPPSQRKHPSPSQPLQPHPHTLAPPNLLSEPNDGIHLSRTRNPKLPHPNPKNLVTIDNRTLDPRATTALDAQQAPADEAGSHGRLDELAALAEAQEDGVLGGLGPAVLADGEAAGDVDDDVVVVVVQVRRQDQAVPGQVVAHEHAVEVPFLLLVGGAPAVARGGRVVAFLALGLWVWVLLVGLGGGLEEGRMLVHVLIISLMPPLVVMRVRVWYEGLKAPGQNKISYRAKDEERKTLTAPLAFCSSLLAILKVTKGDWASLRWSLGV